MTNSSSLVSSASPPESVTPDFEPPQDGFYTANLVNTAVCLAVVNCVFLIHAYVKLAMKEGRLLQEDCRFKTPANTATRTVQYC